MFLFLFTGRLCWLFQHIKLNLVSPSFLLLNWYLKIQVLMMFIALRFINCYQLVVNYCVFLKFHAFKVWKWKRQMRMNDRGQTILCVKIHSNDSFSKFYDFCSYVSWSKRENEIKIPREFNVFKANYLADLSFCAVVSLTDG